MSNTQQAITCPKCGQVQSQTIYERISAVESPELREKILKNQLYKFTCNNCSNTLTLLYPSLYHDAVSGFMIYLIPEKDQERYGSLELDSIMEEYLNLKTTRIVRIPNQLAEKIIIFENGLDDRLVELVKQETIYFLQNQHDAPEILEVYLNKSENGYYFVIIHGPDDFRTIDVDEKVFDIALKKYESYLIQPAPFAIIDQLWASHIFNQHLKLVSS